MGWNETALVAAALLPAIVLCVYVFRKDRVEKEPFGLLLMLLGLGCVICFPAAELEGMLGDLLNRAFEPYSEMQDGVIYMSEKMYKLYSVFDNFIVVALVEEGLKFLVLYIATRNNKNFNSLFDGLIYAVFVSLGFAALENVLYVTTYGWVNALTRAVMAVPAHLYFSVLMGVHYSLWHIHKTARKLEKECEAEGLIGKVKKPFSGRSYLVRSLVLPILAHGAYDYLCVSGTTLATIVLIVFIGLFYGYCYAQITGLSDLDASDENYACVMLMKKYPPLREQVSGDTKQTTTV